MEESPYDREKNSKGFRKIKQWVSVGRRDHKPKKDDEKKIRSKKQGYLDDPQPKQAKQKQLSPAGLFVINDDQNSKGPDLSDKKPSPLPSAEKGDSKESDKEPSFRLNMTFLKDEEAPKYPTMNDIPRNIIEPQQENFHLSMPRRPSSVFCDRRSSIVSDITTPEFPGKLSNPNDSGTIDLPEIPVARRSASFTDLENLHQVLEFFPSVQKGRVETLLRKNSVRTALNILAEESNHDDFPMPEVMERTPTENTIVPKKEPILSSTNFTKPPPTDNQVGLSQMEILLNDDTSKEPSDNLLDDNENRTGLSRANSLISFSEFEKEHQNLQQAMDIFPDANKARVNFLLRQHTLGTVMLMLASENGCE
mmetsp:Transcript_29998/g.45486  ORF Transcript_29998/g.45486 Transcript_29998/m.45486 type:complete len:365 (+) Transcript_29998:194-1288(+)|eukprot:CAMPEP_0178915730 /NCGR_PEP_ID=MMETSP0786-20121207/12198_1 /TAXON_ID=186022 /ORGANISM="Thalassionema frauenfeldii, Strain CCMP 1798" /LENGTH=364 /DNA_ID=CAMNT_0020588891 /DNA_START=172 /DNA_END=1266 /DNA_ORIENTATION=+